MTFKEDLNKDIQKVDKKIEEMSIACLSIKYSKRNATAWFIAWLITFVAFCGTLSYCWYIQKDIGTTTESIEIQDVESIDNSHIKIGENIWVKSN